MEQVIEGWTPDLVRTRLIKAAVLCQRAAGRVGPKEFGTAWPEIAVEWADMLAQVETDELLKGKNQVRVPASARDVTLMEDTLGWPGRYLAGQEGAKRCLKLFLFAKATRRKFGAVCKNRGIPLSTAKRGRAKAFSLIAQGLVNDGVNVEV
jgi:hypothetical protein